MTLALFDLDNTLLNGDSDHAWGEFLIGEGIVDNRAFKQANDQFYEDYKRGQLDIHAYLCFALEPLTRFSTQELAALHQRFMNTCANTMLQPKALELVEQHRAQGHTLMVITATNRFVTEPIVQHHNIDLLLASEPEMLDGRYTGKPTGIPCFQEGKVLRLEQWLQENQETLEGSYFYSDSINDLPLLEQVSYPFAVDPCPKLQETAETRQWPIISLRS